MEEIVIERKPIAAFLIIAFIFSWILFLLPLTLASLDTQTRQYASLGLVSLGMWGPGIAALISTKFVAKQPIKTLGLNKLGPRRFYLWAWLLPLVIVIFTGLLTVLFGVAEFDRNLTVITESMKNAPGANDISPWVVILAQIGIAIFLAPFLNVLFALGEEIGWRGFLLSRLEPLGQWKAILITGVIWGIWHAPVIVQGQNYPGYPIAGIFMMVVFCVLLGAILAWLYFNTRSPWVAALGHGAVNAIAGLPVMFFKSGFNMAFGGTIATFPAWIVMAIFIAWLAWTKRLPVVNQVNETVTNS
jgi:uncharacterized protein